MVQLKCIDADPDLDLDLDLDTTSGNQPFDIILTDGGVYPAENTSLPPIYIGLAQEKGPLVNREDENGMTTHAVVLNPAPIMQYGPPDIGPTGIDTSPKHNDAMSAQDSHASLEIADVDMVPQPLEAEVTDVRAMDLSTEASDPLVSRTTVIQGHFALPPFNAYDAWPPSLAPDGLVAGAASARAVPTSHDMDSDDDISDNDAGPTPKTNSRTLGAIDGHNSSSHPYQAPGVYPVLSPFSIFGTPQPYGESPYPDVSPILAPQDVHPSSQDIPSASPQVAKPELDPIASEDQIEDFDLDLDSHNHHGRGEPQRTEKYRMDLLPNIKGMFRLLDLYSEQGSGGLVDKIIIAQDSLKSLVNSLSPGAYTSITKINFAALDRVSINAVGLYGSKSELVRVLRETGAVDEETANLLLLSDDDRKASQCSLRSGIYLYDPSFGTFDWTMDSPLTVHVIYWPEDTTWDDTAAGGVKRNRVTFMRYLTRLTDQIRALVSPEHAASLVWNQDDFDSDVEEEAADADTDSEDENDDRFFKFEVAKTHEQEEDAKIYPGFMLKHQAIGAQGSANGSTGSTATSSTSSATLVAGETRQGFMITTEIPGKDERRDIQETYNRVRLSSLLTSKRVYLEQSINDDALQILLTEGNLSNRVPDLHKEYREDVSKLSQRHVSQINEAKERTANEIQTNRSFLRQGLKQKILDVIRASYPMLDLDLTNEGNEAERDVLQSSRVYVSNLYKTNPDVQLVCDAVWREADFAKIDVQEYKLLKKRFIYAQTILDKKDGALQEGQRDALTRSILSGFDPIAPSDETKESSMLRQVPRALYKAVVSRIIGVAVTVEEKQDREIRHAARAKPDYDFLNTVAEITGREPGLLQASEALYKMAREWATKQARDISVRLMEKVEVAQRRGCEEQIRAQVKHQDTEDRKSALLRFRESLNAVLVPEGSQPDVVLTHVRQSATRYSSEIYVRGYSDTRSESLVRHSIWPIELTGEDITAIRANPQHVPRPRTRYQSIDFSLPQDNRVRHVQLLRGDRYLVVANTPAGTSIWLQSQVKPFPSKPTKQLPLPHHHVLAIDENKRLVTFINTDGGRCTLHVFIMDETFSTLSGRGTPLDVAKWYMDGPALIRLAVFFPGTEELCLVEYSGRARIYSFLSQGFRPSFIQLPSGYESVQCAPDASALLVVEGMGSGDRVRRLRVYHRASFGTGSAQNGILRDLPETLTPGTSFAVTSLGKQNISLLALLPSEIGSASVQISRQETEFKFRAKQERTSSSTTVATKHNSLLDCFSEVWGRYPVVPAIKRETISADGRLDAAVTLVTDNPRPQFSRYFKDMIREFEKLTRKPTDQELDSIQLQSVAFPDVSWYSSTGSVFRAGEWLVELLCLIPIHIAIARENRFMPLKDGVFDSRLEQQLLGAEVSRIIDTLSLGWYESIFGSYLAAKEVKVISSMGEQSVGKSYSLNHIVDSSFAGSAVRTTEGVWLSVCPSKDTLVVALDFEGVHSIERTAQEDMLLVLFNTALSNLVIFRNNFALSRDVANMFTSFQASTHIFDPASNPRLFKGRLAVVIKDVVDSDKKEIVQEFFAKFSQIVDQEQAENFITKLHAGQLTVIPWNVIESREFYTLFSKLSRQLFKQKTTHTSAGEFLMTLKTLMAKLKAQDWGAMDQTLVKHRCALLSASLRVALATGYAEIDPIVEDLKNLDSQEVIQFTDSNAIFYLDKSPEDRQVALQKLLISWHSDPARHDVKDLSQHLQDLVKNRLTHVDRWMDSNISRFQADNADIRALKRERDELSEALKANAQPCFMECSWCRLSCLLIKSHESPDHSCNTSHKCLEVCEFLEDHDELGDEQEGCGLPAGHSGRHICDGAEHLCGQACHLTGRRGCQRRCTKPIDHMEEEHACSARTHQCGAPCSLRDIPTPHGPQYSCNGMCTRPFDEEHDQHSCDDRLACPIRCELCQRFCTTGDHFHSLVSGAASIHLCGQEHSCRHDCELPGICEVNTTPHAVETLFEGRHESFQFTKYTQVAKRLICAVAIASGERDHPGPHVHSTMADPFHYCETACLNCGYICQLPQGHPQTEHETAHGSMENTSWAIEGAPDAFIEVQGRKYAARDGGAPQLCSSVCLALGRHAHIDYCRNEQGDCREPESEHITEPMLPEPNKPKDWVSHKAFWARTGFKDPYSRDDQAEFAKCDAQCAGPEHEATATALARPSYCTMPIFHPPQLAEWTGHATHVSKNGHSFPCPNPSNMAQAFHVIFVLDRSGSMAYKDRRPIPNTPVFNRINSNNCNRYGAVLSALHGFWLSRSSGQTIARRDAYSVILFESSPETLIANDVTSTPDQLLSRILFAKPRGGTYFDAALASAKAVMEAHWSTDRSPVVIFLSDGECGVDDNIVYDLCNRAVALNKTLSLHAVSFGPANSSSSLRQMVRIANEVAQSAPRDPLSPPVPSEYTGAMNTIRLAETFLNIAESLKKPRASLIRT
ncbi:hypothetical protein FRB94_011064 [Tulasnella sp. JGI-2019a]|nr:hypothetical protein FRB94_011064 [Tulasnella sp. JGI-2019a]